MGSTVFLLWYRDIQEGIWAKTFDIQVIRGRTWPPVASCRRLRSHFLKCEDPLKTLATKGFGSRAQVSSGVEGMATWGGAANLPRRSDHPGPLVLQRGPSLLLEAAPPAALLPAWNPCCHLPAYSHICLLYLLSPCPPPPQQPEGESRAGNGNARLH